VETVWKKRGIMTKYKNMEKIDDYISLGTVNDIYQARIKVSDSPRRWKWTSTKIKADGTKPAKNKAIATAHRFQSDYEYRLDKGLDLRRTPFIKFANGLINDWRKKAQSNEQLYADGNYDYDNDYERIPFGKVMANGDHSVWRMNTYSQYRKAIKEFQTFLESEGEQNIAINDIEQDLWTRFIEWRNKTQPKRTAGTLLKYKTALTKVFKIAKQKREIDSFKVSFSYGDAKTSPKKQDIELKTKDIESILIFARTRAIQIKDKGQSDWHIYYQFYLWLGMCITTGIRPPSTRKNALQDKHVVAKKGFTILKRENMKGISYEAVCLPSFLHYYNEALRLKKEYKVKSPYLICHLQDSGRKVKGESILDFRKQKEHMLEKLELPVFTRPYEFRDYYITHQIDKGIPPIQVARSCGTSLNEIDRVYYRKKLTDEASILMSDNDFAFDLQPIEI
jgi:hypothetical protein